jgi:hypothetical protein
MKVLFAPDWRNGVPYQRLLADALAAHDVSVTFLSHYKRLLPLTRLVRQHRAELLHLHWPEAYYPALGDRWDFWRRARFRADLTLAARHTPFVLTAHNLQEHNYGHRPFARANYAAAYRRARERLVATYGLRAENIRIIPHGDLSVVMPPPLGQAEARARLGLPAGPLCLMFGAVEPYKGQEEVLAWWRNAQPDAMLVVAGKPNTPEYGETIRRAAEGLPRVALHFQWLADPELALFLSAADVALFNYRTIFTSGAASLARSWGLPVLLPARLDTVGLAEPDPRVWRFDRLETDFAEKLAGVLSIAPDYAAAASWREETAWPRVAELTAAGYREALGLRALT